MPLPNSGTLLQQVQSALSRGKSLDAAELCRRILAADPLNVDALYLLGLAHAMTGEIDAAIAQWQGTLRIQPRHFATLANMGAALSQQGRHPEAIAILRNAIAIDSSQAHAHYNLGVSLLAMSELDAAIDSLRTAAKRERRMPEIRNNLGVAYRRAGRLEEASAQFTAALAANPDYADARNNLADLQYERGVELHRAGQLDAAVAAYERLLKLRPEDVAGWRDRGRALESLQKLGAALQSLRKAVELAPADPTALASVVSCGVRICDWTLTTQSLQRLREAAGGLETVHPFLALSVCQDPAEQLRISSAAAAPYDAVPLPAREASVPRTTTVDSGRIRIAYVSADLRDHAVAHVLVGVLEKHDRSKFEVHAIALQPEASGTAIGRRLRGAFEHFHDVTTRSDAEIAQLLRALKIDIAVDLNGYTVGARPGIFAQRGAPVQASYLGYAGTLGAAYMDYLLADEIVIPRGQEMFYREQVVRLPHCYLPHDDERAIGAPPTRARAGLPESALVLCAFTNTYKITTEVFVVWMRLLQAAPGSVLWLREAAPEAMANLRREAETRGVDSQRLVFAPHVVSVEEHLGRHTLADLFLDTSPYNAHSTATDALWAGVPILTCAGKTFAARVAASALTAVGLPELITNNLADYEQKGLMLLSDPQRLWELRSRLQSQRNGAPLFDTTRLCRHIEAAYSDMHSRAARGEPASTFDVEA
jgi:predicted O-linked N-acetylglucosamine transferase (SPINDLY family)